MSIRRFCVFAGSSSGSQPAYSAAAQELGRRFAERGLGLVYGGGRIGLMGVLADAVLAARGEVIGVIPESLCTREVAHYGLTDLRVVASMHERKALMADLSDGFIALPGGWGTLDEFFEALTWGQLGLHQKPCGFLNVHGYFDRLLSFLSYSIDQGFVGAEHASMVSVSASPSGLLDMLINYQPGVAVEKWITRATS